MDQSLVASAVRRLKVRNTKNVHLTKKYFSDLSHLAAACLNSAGSFSPGKAEPLSLRNQYMPLYRWMAIQLSDLYEFPVDAEFLSGARVTSDLAEGVIDIRVVLTKDRKPYTFTITFNDEGAPYSTAFAELVQKNGGNGARFASLIGLV